MSYVTLFSPSTRLEALRHRIVPTSGETQVEHPSNSHHQRSFLHSRFVKKAVHAIKGATETTSERRAMKVLGIVFFVFLVAWLPFSILNILSAACRSCDVQPSLLNLTSWLGYISSNLNPVNHLGEERSRRQFVVRLDHLHGIQCSLSSCLRLHFNVSNELLFS